MHELTRTVVRQTAQNLLAQAGIDRDQLRSAASLYLQTGVDMLAAFMPLPDVAAFLRHCADEIEQKASVRPN